MSAAFIDTIEIPQQTLPPVAVSVRRTACYLSGSGEPIFAWLHQPEVFVGHGIVICPPIGYEQLHAHRALRHLADSLAQQQFPVVRLDWHGTGDSPGTDDDPNRWAVWSDNLRTAVDWLRRELGCHEITLVGLRIGATIAASVAAEADVTNMVLWSPVVKGKAFVREQKAISLTADASSRPAWTNGFEAAGFSLNEQTIAELGKIDLTANIVSCRRALVVSRDDVPTDDRLLNHLKLAGITTEQIKCPGFVGMMAEPHRSEVPECAIQQITDWLNRAITVHGQSAIGIGPVRHSTDVSISLASVGRPPQVCTIRESALRISDDPDLFGILSEPSHGVDADVPVVVLLNAGASYRIGPGRLNLSIARRLASLGFRCLRFDLNGLGDSVADRPEFENDSYPSTAFRDIDLILKHVQQRCGTRRVVLMGLCSGAYAAFQSAAQIEDRALVESILINPLTFYWADGMTLDASPTKHLMSFHYYRSVMTDPRKWLKLLSGRSKLGVAGAWRVLTRRLRASRSQPLANKSSADCPNVTSLGHPRRDDLSGDLQRVVAHDRRLTMFFSSSDPGFGILNHHARRQANQLRKGGRLKIQFINEADHTFSHRDAREELIDAIADHLRDRYQPAIRR